MPTGPAARATAAPSALRVVVGTAGHVDHGKTALVKALTGIDTDRLPEEKRRGITLEAGYAHLTLPGIGEAGVVDVPGHERFLRAMVAAAGGIDVAVLCIAADEGPMPQTGEHLDVLRLLGVKAGVIAITKSDLLPGLGEDHRELLLLELKSLVAGTFLEKAEVVPCSARTGQGLPELLAAVSRAVKEQQSAPRPQQGPLFLPLDRSFAIKGFGTIVTGTLFSGELAAEDEVDVVGAGAKPRGVRVRGVQVHGGPVEKARAGQRTAANLAGVEVDDAPRGSALVQAGMAQAAQILDVEVELLAAAPRPLRDKARLLAHVGTAQVPCVVALLDRTELLPGEKALAQLRLGQPTAALAGLRFLLRGELGKPHAVEGPARSESSTLRSPGNAGSRKHASTLGGGRILSVQPRRRRRSRPADLAALVDLAGDDPLKQAERVLFEAGLPGLAPAMLASRGPFGAKAAATALERLAQMGRAVLFDRDARVHVHKDLLGKLEKRILARLTEHAAHERLDPSILREELRQRVGSPPARLFTKALADLQDGGELRADAERVRPAGVAKELTGPDSASQEKLAKVLDQALLAPPRIDELPGLIGEPVGQTLALLKSLQSAGRAMKISEDLWFSAAALHDLRQRLNVWLKEKGSIDAQGFKELTGQSRKFTIPLAEWFDKERVTLRVGDKRVARTQR